MNSPFSAKKDGKEGHPSFPTPVSLGSHAGICQFHGRKILGAIYTIGFPQIRPAPTPRLTGSLLSSTERAGGRHCFKFDSAQKAYDFDSGSNSTTFPGVPEGTFLIRTARVLKPPGPVPQPDRIRARLHHQVTGSGAKNNSCQGFQHLSDSGGFLSRVMRCLGQYLIHRILRIIDCLLRITDRTSNIRTSA